MRVAQPPQPYRGLQIQRARGVELFDKSRGRLLDLTSGFGVAALGYGCAPVAEAVRRRLLRFGHAIPTLVAYEGDDIASDLIVSRIGFPQGGALLTSSGSEAIEVARKLAFLVTGKPDIVTLSGGYHGQSLGTLPLTGQRALRAPFEDVLGRAALVLPMPDLCRSGMDAPSWGEEQCVGLLETWLDSADCGGSRVGAVLVEPMQNLAGYRLYERSLGAAISQACRKRGVLLIADEVFTGFARTGTWSLSRDVGYQPAIVCVGKALTGGVPGGACVASREHLRLLFPKGGAPLHAPTFCNSPVIAGAMEAAIKLIVREKLVQRACELHHRMVSRLAELSERHLVRQVRGRGAAVAIEFVDDVKRKRSGASVVLDVVRRLLERGILALNSGFPRGNVLLLCPPLIIPNQRLDDAMDRVCAAICAAAGTEP